MKFFKVNGGRVYYIYDPPTNFLLKVDEVVYLILRSQWENRLFQAPLNIPPNKISKAFQQIEALRKKYGAFNLSRKYFTQIEFPYSKEEIKEKLETDLSHIILEVTQNCNFRCKYCVYSGAYRGERPHRPVYMDKEIAEKALLFLKNRAKEQEVIRIGFYGGEPLLNFKLIKYVVKRAKEIFKNKKLKFSLTTNGSLLYGEIVDFLAKNKILLFVSIDGPKEIHDRYRLDIKGRGTFAKIVKNLKTLKENYPDYYHLYVGFITVLAPPIELFKVVNFFENWDLRTQAPHFLTLIDPVNTNFYQLYSTSESMDKYREEFQELSNKELKRVLEVGTAGKFADFLIYLKDLATFHSRAGGKIGSTLYIGGFCIPGHDRLFVTPDGSLYPCERVHTHFKIGTLEEGFYYQKIYKTIEKILEIRKKLGCEYCWLGRLCSMCFATIMRNEKVREDLMKSECKKNKEKWEKILKIYIELYEKRKDFLQKLAL